MITLAISASVWKAGLFEPAQSLIDGSDCLKHHCASDSSARPCLLEWIEANYVEGVIIKRDGKIITLHRAEKGSERAASSFLLARIANSICVVWHATNRSIYPN
jgi:hypothetical protein